MLEANTSRSLPMDLQELELESSEGEIVVLKKIASSAQCEKLIVWVQHGMAFAP
jgi:hypothetical protein